MSVWLRILSLALLLLGLSFPFLFCLCRLHHVCEMMVGSSPLYSLHQLALFVFSLPRRVGHGPCHGCSASSFASHPICFVSLGATAACGMWPISTPTHLQHPFLFPLLFSCCSPKCLRAGVVVCLRCCHCRRPVSLARVCLFNESNCLWSFTIQQQARHTYRMRRDVETTPNFLFWRAPM